MSTTPTAEFFESIEDGEVDCVRRMLRATSALVGAVSDYGLSPLMKACSAIMRTPEMVRVLIESGADVNARTAEGYTALHMIVDVNGPTGKGPIPALIARLLVDAGAELEVRQHWGWTPLMRAVVEGTNDELRALVAVGGDVNKKFPSHTLPEFLCGRTTLMAAVPWPEKVRILIEAGVDVSAQDDFGESALDYAQRSLLEAAGEDLTRTIVGEIEIAGVRLTPDQLAAAGIDVAALMEQLKDLAGQELAKTPPTPPDSAIGFDYRAQVASSIAMLEAALNNPRETP